MRHRVGLAGRWLAAGIGVAAASYAAYVATTWYRYGRVTGQGGGKDRDALLDRFMPTCDVREHHHVRIAAPAEITFGAATEMYLQQSPIVRGIFKARQWIMRSRPAPEPKHVPSLRRCVPSVGVCWPKSPDGRS